MSKHPAHRTWWDRLLAGVLCLALTLGLMPVTGLFQTAEAHWADAYADRLEEWGVLPPEWQWSKNLDTTVKRAEFVAMCNRAFGYTRLGEMPFVDVSPDAWYYQDINIAYNAGYFSGTSNDPSAPKASPDGTLTREMAIVAVAVNLMLQQTVGESLGFTDSHKLSSWSANWVGAAVAEGVVSGYPDGSFRPQAKITRGELVTLLVGLLGTPVSQEGDYELGNIYGNVVISSSHVTLRDTVILGNLYIAGGVDLGSVLLENVTVLGRIVIAGGGVSEAARSSVVLRNVVADELVIDSLVDQFVTVSAYGLTQIPNTYVRYEAYLDDSCAEGFGLQYIEFDADPGTRLQLAGSIKEVVNKTPRSSLQLVQGTAKKITIDEEATGSELLVDINTRADVVNLDTACYVYGKGDILYLNIWADGCEIALLPEHIDIRAGLMAVLIDGDERREIGSTDANELSQEPRLLSGYPSVDRSNLMPTSAEGLYAGNKPGTIYWAVSAVANGSVLENDLIKNPAYGGNIYEGNSGSITVTSRGSEYSRLISELEPDGSYYISAILVDERGNRSPVKVISFTTPDDSTPEFVEEPHMTKVTCDVAQVTTMVNKNCQLYWVLLRAGSTAPTPRNFQTGSFGGNYGYGSINVAKNVPISLQVNSGRLQEQTGYDLYLWLNDLNGTHSSAVVKVLNESGNANDPSFITPDQTPPVVSNVTQTRYLDDAIEFTFEVSEPATLYWYVVAETDSTLDRMTAERRLRTVVDGAGSIVSGSREATRANTPTTVPAADFKNALKFSDWGTHSFKLYYVAQDADENFSEVGVLNIQTADTDEPTVTLKFPENKMSNGRPQADADVTLVFSEQVKGYESAKTFVELYSEVEHYENLGLTDSDPLLKNAKAALGEELEKHIKLYYLEYSWDKPGTELKPKGVNPNEADYGWLDLSQATVRLQSNGTVELTLVNGKAVQLSGGMTYDFHFEDIYDNAYIPNALVVLDSAGNPIKEPDYLSFTTVFAQVVLTMNTSEGKMTTTKDGDAIRTITVDGKPIRLDMCIDVRPQSTKNVAESVYWDLIMWCDNSVAFELYRKVGSGGWELAATVSYSTSSEGISWNRVNIVTDTKPEQAKTGLDQDTIYTYGIHFTSVRNIPEGNVKDGVPEVWGDTVTMEFSVVMGDSLNISNLSGAMDANNNAYYRYVTSDNAPLSEVGVYYDESNNNARMSTLVYKCEFIDKRAPEFVTGFPMFSDVSSSSFNMTVMTDRAGTMYYVVAPVTPTGPAIGTSIPNGSSSIFINASNDGSQFVDEDGKPLTGTALYNAIKALENSKTYIPTDGADRDGSVSGPNSETYDIKNSIWFMTGGNALDGVRGKYNTPIADDITDPEKAFPNAVAQGIITFEPEPVDTAQTTVPVNSLKPDTEYYVYIVLQGRGKADEVVQVYRVRTKDAEPPRIDVYRTTASTKGTSTTGASITVRDRDSGEEYDNPLLFRTLWRKDKLPDLFNQYYIWADGLKDGTAGYGPFKDEAEAKTELAKLDEEIRPGENSIKTVLDAILDTYDRGLTWFDWFATDTMKTQVMIYITSSTSAGSVEDTTYYYTAVNESNMLQECVDELKEGGEYVLLICARHNSIDGTSGADYGFGATQGLYEPQDPPELRYPSVGNDGTVTITAAFDRAYDPVEDEMHYGIDEFGTGPQSWYYYGTIEIRFNNPIYVYYNDALVQVVAPSTDNKVSDGQISILDVISSSVITKATDNADHTSFTLTYYRIRNGQGFTISNLFNRSGEGKNSKTLTVTFETKLEGEMWESTVTGQVTDMREVVPCFNVSWK